MNPGRTDNGRPPLRQPEGGCRRAERHRLELRLPARPEDVSSVRRALEQMGLPEAILEDAKLLASELVANSIRHAGLRPEDVVHVSVAWSGAVLRVIVQDRGSTAASPIAGSIRPEPGAQSGWGLYLVDQLADRWGTKMGGRPGYWFELIARPATST